MCIRSFLFQHIWLQLEQFVLKLILFLLTVETLKFLHFPRQPGKIHPPFLFYDSLSLTVRVVRGLTIVTRIGTTKESDYPDLIQLYSVILLFVYTSFSKVLRLMLLERHKKFSQKLGSVSSSAVGS